MELIVTVTFRQTWGNSKPEEVVTVIVGLTRHPAIINRLVNTQHFFVGMATSIAGWLRFYGNETISLNLNIGFLRARRIALVDTLVISQLNTIYFAWSVSCICSSLDHSRPEQPHNRTITTTNISLYISLCYSINCRNPAFDWYSDNPFGKSFSFIFYLVFVHVQIPFSIFPCTVFAAFEINIPRILLVGFAAIAVVQPDAVA